MNDDLRAQLRQDPLVQDFAERVRHCGEARSFFEALDGSPCPYFIDSIRRGHAQRGGTIDADPTVIAGVVIQLTFKPTPTPSLLERIRAFLRRAK